MNCPKCGAENPDDSMFCQKCGTNLLDKHINFEHLTKIAIFVIVALLSQIYIYITYGDVDITTWSYGNIGSGKWSRIFMFLGLSADWINAAGWVYIWWVINKFNKLLPMKHQIKGITAIFIVILLLTIALIFGAFYPSDELDLVIGLLFLPMIILQFYVSVKMIKQWNTNTENMAIQNTSFAKLGKCLLWYSILSLLVGILAIAVESVFPLILDDVIEIGILVYMCILAIKL